MSKISRVLAFFAASVVCAAALPAQQQQGPKYIVPDSWERETKVDDEGLKQWVEFEEENCPNCRSLKKMACTHCSRLVRNEKCPECDMKKEAPCRACGGLGHWPDPLLKVTCPACMGAGMFPCDICGWEGNHPVKGGGAKPQKCVSCKGNGGYPCTVCKGARVVDGPKLKPSVAEAKLSDLIKARDAVDGVQKALAAYEPLLDARKEVKAYVKLLRPATKYLPAVKSYQKMFETVMKKHVFKGRVWQGFEERELSIIKRFMSHIDYYLKHQKHLLDLCVERAEFNAKVLADKKGE